MERDECLPEVLCKSFSVCLDLWLPRWDRSGTDQRGQRILCPPDHFCRYTAMYLELKIYLQLFLHRVRIDTEQLIEVADLVLSSPKLCLCILVESFGYGLYSRCDHWVRT
nr:hypothetical protein [Pseudonocardia sp. ICBG1142]